MNDAAIVAALVLANASFFLQQQQAKTGKALCDLKRDGQADNASADDDYVVA